MSAATLHTNAGPISIEFFDEDAPKTVENFRKLAGDGFGEIALLKDVPRTATVRAARDCRLLALDRVRFISAVTGHRRSQEAADSVVEQRLTGTAETRSD